VTLLLGHRDPGWLEPLGWTVFLGALLAAFAVIGAANRGAVLLMAYAGGFVVSGVIFARARRSRPAPPAPSRGACAGAAARADALRRLMRRAAAGQSGAAGTECRR
jgi:hypothetical protein